MSNVNHLLEIPPFLRRDPAPLGTAPEPRKRWPGQGRSKCTQE